MKVWHILRTKMRYIAFIFSLLIIGARTASAHVAYVLPTETLSTTNGTDFSFLLSPLKSTDNLMIMVSTVMILGALYYLAHHIPRAVKEFDYAKKRLSDYQNLIPWILRLGLGILFMGAALHHAFVSPILSDVGGLASYEFVIGFLLLAGFMIAPALVAIIAYYLVSLTYSGYMLGSLEVLGSAIALFLLADGRPGIDDIFGIPTLFRNRMAKFVPLVLRIALGGSFIFLAFYEKIFNPHFFSSVVDTYNLTFIIPVSSAMWTLSVGIVELIIGLFILTGFKTRFTSAVAFFVVVMTFFFFKEDVYSHVTIFAVLSALFITGGGHWSLDEHFAHKPAVQASRKIAARKSPGRRAAKKKTATV